MLLNAKTFFFVLVWCGVVCIKIYEFILNFPKNILIFWKGHTFRCKKIPSNYLAILAFIQLLYINTWIWWALGTIFLRLDISAKHKSSFLNKFSRHTCFIFSSINVLVYALRFKSCNNCSMVESQLHAYIRVQSFGVFRVTRVFKLSCVYVIIVHYVFPPCRKQCYSHQLKEFCYLYI